MSTDPLTTAEDEKSAGAGTLADDVNDDAVTRLAAALNAAQTCNSDLTLRYIAQVERCQALDKALYGERLRTAVMKRDLEAFQRQLQAAQDAHAAAEMSRAQAERLVAEARNELRMMRQSRLWRLGRRYWAISRLLRRS